MSHKPTRREAKERLYDTARELRNPNTPLAAALFDTLLSTAVDNHMGVVQIDALRDALQVLHRMAQIDRRNLGEVELKTTSPP